MSWSYSGNPSDSDSDAVRFLVGDVDTDNQLVSDEEIAWALAQGGVYAAASLIAFTIAAAFSRQADKAVDSLKISYSQKSAQYSKLAGDLRYRAATDGLCPYAGGISVSDKDAVRGDSDRVRPSFKVGMDG